MTNNKFPYSGKSFIIEMNNGLTVKNSYMEDGKHIEIEFLNSDLKGTKMVVLFKWKSVTSEDFLISWQESDNSTVVHCDNFVKNISNAFYTTSKGEFFVMEGIIKHQ